MARNDPQVASKNDGYAAIDAMVALLILAMSVIFSLQATGQADRVVDMAWETRRAQTLLSHLVETAPRNLEDAVGQSDGFSWRVETRVTGAERPIAVCRREVRLESAATRRRFQASTLEVCPVEAPA